MRRPKWSLECVEERRNFYASTAENLILDLEDVPPQAEIYVDDYDLYAIWYRDMTDDEYLREVERRRKFIEKQKRKERAKLDQLAKKLGVEVKEKQ